MIVYPENPKESLDKFLELIKFGKADGYKVNIQKSIVLLYTSNKEQKRNLKNDTIYNSFKNTEFIGINVIEMYKISTLKTRICIERN